MPGRFQIVFYPAAVVVGQQKLTFGQHRKGGEVQVVGMTVREPVVSCFSYRLHLCCRDSMRLRPTTEISAVTNPWISCEHGPIVIVRNEDSAANRFEKPHLIGPFDKFEPAGSGSDYSLPVRFGSVSSRSRDHCGRFSI